MITKNGTITATTNADESALNELNKPNNISAIFLIVCGAILIVCGVVIFIVGNGEDGFDYGYLLLFLGVMFLVLGSTLIISYKKNLKAALKYAKVEEVEFLGDHLICREYVNGEKTMIGKIYYSWIVRTRESQNYLFLYNTAITAIIVAKSQLSPDEIAHIKLLCARYAGTTSPAPASAQTTASQSANLQGQTTVAEPLPEKAEEHAPEAAKEERATGENNNPADGGSADE